MRKIIKGHMEEKPTQVITSNVLKSFFANIIYTGLPALIFIMILWFGGKYIDFSLISDSFSTFGLDFNFEDIYYQYIIQFISLIAIILIIINTMGRGLSSVEIYGDKIVFRKGLGTKHILLSDVVKVNYTQDLLPKLLHSGKLEIMVSGQGKGNLEIDFVTDVDKRTSEFQERINQYKVKQANSQSAVETSDNQKV